MKQPVTKLFGLFLFLTLFFQTGFSQLNMTFRGQVNYDQELSDIWGYADGNGNEYALVGMFNGVSIVNVTDPENPEEVDFIDGVPSGWRDIKTWGEYAYVINETGAGLAVIDLSDLPNSASAYNWAPNLPGLGTLSSCHNIYIDENGFAYLVGCTLNSGGMLIVDVATTPGSPEFVSAGAPIYSHDVYVRDNIAYHSEIYQGRLGIYDISDKDNVQLLATQPTEAQFTHNAWLSDDSNIIFTTDEVANAPVGSYDISDLNNIKELDQFRPYETLGDGVIPHNVHVWNDYIIVSYYTDGCLILDAARPDNLIEVGNFDTYIPTSTGFAGAWGAYPYLPSGLVLVSDMGNGLFVLEPNYVRACYLEGKITDASNGNGILDATVDILDTPIFENSDLQGIYKTGVAVSGTYQVEVSKPGYKAETVEVEVENGEVTILDVELEPLSSFGFSGKVVDLESGEAIPDAIVHIQNDEFDFQLNSDANGNFSIASFYEGDYEVTAGKWGYKTIILDQNVEDGSGPLTLELEEGLEDIFSLDLGWEISNSAFQGGWERGEPIGVFIGPPITPTDTQIGPEDDTPEDIGVDCYVTGNTADLQGGILIGGATTMKSPKFDLSDYNNPHISFYTWFFNIQQSTFEPGDGYLRVLVSNGMNNKLITEVTYEDQGDISWVYHEFALDTLLESSDDMQITVFANANTNFNDVVEAGIDYVRIWDAEPVVATEEVALENNLALSTFPNPTNSGFSISYELKGSGDNGQIIISDVAGRQVQTIAVQNGKGQIRFNQKLEPGIYWISLQDGDGILTTQKLVVQ
jgi:choice-of-anchor B domain-containing protein